MTWSIFPRNNQRQRVRVERLLLAFAVSAGAVALSLWIAWAGYLSYSAVAWFAAIVLAAAVLFYTLIRSDINLRFSDPSLTVPLMVTAGLATSYLVFEAEAARLAVTALYVFALLLGALRLRLRELLAMSMFYVLCYVAVIYLARRSYPDIDLRREEFRVGVIALVFGGVSALGGYVHRLRESLKAANARLLSSLAESQALATIDSLTGCYNRRHGLALLAVECARVARGAALSIGLADLDHFKVVNDRYGHAVGDEVLKSFADTVQNNIRGTDFLARYGGEEFLIVFSQTSLDDAKTVAERLRRAVTETTNSSLPPEQRVTVSIGIAEHRGSDSPEATLARADAALYRAKREGRNSVVCAA